RALPPDGSLAITSTVSSPATVPRTAGQAAWSMTEARNCAAPAGVRSTTRFALASADVRSSFRYLPSRADEAGGSGCSVTGGACSLAASAAGGAGGVRDGCVRSGKSRPIPARDPGPPGSPGSAVAMAPVRRRPAGQGVDQRAVRRPQPDDADLVQVPRQGGLRDVHAGVPVEQHGQ